MSGMYVGGGRLGTDAGKKRFQFREHAFLSIAEGYPIPLVWGKKKCQNVEEGTGSFKSDFRGSYVLL